MLVQHPAVAASQLCSLYFGVSSTEPTPCWPELPEMKFGGNAENVDQAKAGLWFQLCCLQNRYLEVGRRRESMKTKPVLLQTLSSPTPEKLPYPLMVGGCCQLSAEGSGSGRFHRGLSWPFPHTRVYV